MPEGSRLVATNGARIHPRELTERLAAWQAQPERMQPLSQRWRHDVHRLQDEAVGDVVVKSTNPRKARRRSAVLAFLNGWWLHRALPGAVPEPIGAIDHYDGRTITASFLVARYVPGRPVAELLKAGNLDSDTQEAIGRLLMRVHASGVFLQDNRPDNFLLTGEPHPDTPPEQYLTLPDLEALLPGRPGRFRAARLLLKLRGRGVGFDTIWAAYWRERGDTLNPLQRAILWGIYTPARRGRRLVLGAFAHRRRSG